MLSSRLPAVALDSSMASRPLPGAVMCLAVAMSSSSYLPARTTTAERRAAGCAGRAANSLLPASAWLEVIVAAMVSVHNMFEGAAPDLPFRIGASFPRALPDSSSGPRSKPAWIELRDLLQPQKRPSQRFSPRTHIVMGFALHRLASPPACHSAPASRAWPARHVPAAPDRSALPRAPCQTRSGRPSASAASQQGSATTAAPDRDTQQRLASLGGVVTDAAVPEGHQGLHGFLYGEGGAEGEHDAAGYSFREVRCCPCLSARVAFSTVHLHALLPVNQREDCCMPPCAHVLLTLYCSMHPAQM